MNLNVLLQIPFSAPVNKSVNNMVGRTRTVPVSFRVDESTLSALSERAKECGVSVGVFVRGVVIAEIHRPLHDLGSQLSDLLERAKAIEQTVELLKVNQSKSLFYALTHIGGMSPDPARDLVRSKLSEGETDGR